MHTAQNKDQYDVTIQPNLRNYSIGKTDPKNKERWSPAQWKKVSLTIKQCQHNLGTLKVGVINKICNYDGLQVKCLSRYWCSCEKYLIYAEIRECQCIHVSREPVSSTSAATTTTIAYTFCLTGLVIHGYFRLGLVMGPPQKAFLLITDTSLLQVCINPVTKLTMWKQWRNIAMTVITTNSSKV